ncbi:UNVERIFIED_CONTAM: hypothetical protein FKN15_018967 [Acipenser sinensis]
MCIGSAATLLEPLSISTDGKAGQALEAGEGHHGPEGTDVLGPGVVAAAPTMAPPEPIPVPAPVSPRGVQSELESPELMTEEEDALLIVASWNEDSFPTEMEEGEEPALSTEAEPSSESASEAIVPPFSSSMSALIESASNICRSLGRQLLSYAGPCLRCRLRLPTLSLPNVPGFHGGTDKLGLVDFHQWTPSLRPWSRLHRWGACPRTLHARTHSAGSRRHLKRAYAAEAQVTRLANTASILTTYMDGMLWEAPLPEPVASELRLLSGTLLQISGLQGQALGRESGKPGGGSQTAMAVTDKGP